MLQLPGLLVLLEVVVLEVHEDAALQLLDSLLVHLHRPAQQIHCITAYIIQLYTAFMKSLSLFVCTSIFHDKLVSTEFLVYSLYLNIPGVNNLAKIRACM